MTAKTATRKPQAHGPYRLRLAGAMTVSLLAHALLLSLQFGLPGIGLPMLELPWRERRAQAVDLQVVFVAPASGAAAAAPPPALTAPPSASPAATGLRLVPPAKALPAPPTRKATTKRAKAKPPVIRRPSRPRVKREAPVIALNEAREDSLNMPALEPANDAPPQPLAIPDDPAPDEVPIAKESEPAAVAPAEEVQAAFEAEEREVLRQAEESARRKEEARAAQEEESARRLARALEDQRIEEARQREEAERLALEREERRKAEEAALALRRQQEEALRREQEEAARRALALEEERRAEALRLQAERIEREQREAMELQARRQEEAALEAARQQAAARERERQAEELAARRKADAEAAAAQAAQAAKAASADRAARRDPELMLGDSPAGNTRIDALPRSLTGGGLAGQALEQARRTDFLHGDPPIRQADSSMDIPRRRSIFGSKDVDVGLRMYVESWRLKIERNGSINYPRAALEKAKGDPVVTVTLRSDGSVEEVRIHRSSGRPELDEAVHRIVRINARYSAFPPELSRRYDVIEIRRVWNFDDRLRILEEVQ